MWLYLYSSTDRSGNVADSVFAIETNKSCGVIDLYAKASQQN